MLHVIGRLLESRLLLSPPLYLLLANYFCPRRDWQGAVRHGIGLLLVVVGGNLHRIDWAKPYQVVLTTSCVRRHAQQGTGFPRVRD